MSHTPPFRILIGERDTFMQHMLAHSLGKHFQVSFVEDGLSLLRQTREILPDLVIMEGLLSSLDGYTVCQKLKNDAATAHIPVLFHTLLADESRARQAGADGFLLKPVLPQEIETKVEELLNVES
ncbi:MAG TPA: response regulator [Chloroflexi bacterium]|nr:MAG: response regulator [Chloroflexota bacterium]HDD55512.1 response regulator [Chloroflexota bacterium]